MSAEGATPDVETFLERFRHFGRAASVESYTALFHPEATLFDDGMERGLRRAEIPAHIEATLALLPGFAMVPERWRARDGRVFVEARNEAKLAGEPVAWRAVYRVELDGSLVRNGRRYFDRGPLLARLDPSRPQLVLLPGRAEGPACAAPEVEGGLAPEALVAELAERWREGRPDAIARCFREDAALLAPGSPRPLGRSEIGGYYRALLERLSGAPLAPRGFAGDRALLFVEWEASAHGRKFGAVERFDLVDGRILAARLYFESGSLLES